jgi:protease I
VRIEAEAVGAHWVEADVVRDGRIVSAPTWQAHPAFYREIFACLQASVPA